MKKHPSLGLIPDPKYDPELAASEKLDTSSLERAIEKRKQKMQDRDGKIDQIDPLSIPSQNK